MPSAWSRTPLLQVQATNEVGEQRLLDADQRVTVDAGLALEAIVGPHRHLSREAVAARIDRRTDDRREAGIDERLSADHDEHARPLGISASRVADAVQVATLHRSAW